METESFGQTGRVVAADVGNWNAASRESRERLATPLPTSADERRLRADNANLTAALSDMRAKHDATCARLAQVELERQAERELHKTELANLQASLQAKHIEAKRFSKEQKRLSDASQADRLQNQRMNDEVQRRAAEYHALKESNEVKSGIIR